MMHFDILVPATFEDIAAIHRYGNAYLLSKGIADADVRTSECEFCHVEQAEPDVIEQITAKGYSIVEIENCD